MALTNFTSGIVISSTFLNKVDRTTEAIVGDSSGLTWNGAKTSAASAITSTGYWGKVGNTSSTPTSVYEIPYPAITHYDGFASTLEVEAGSNLIHMSALSGYIRNKIAVSGIERNSVALFGVGTAEVNSAATWGINTLLQDNSTRAVGALTGVILVNELDFNVMCPGTTVIGLSLGGNSLSQPTTSNALIINSLGTGITWGGGLICGDAVVDYFTSCGLASAAGASVNSSRMGWRSTNAASTVITTSLRANLGRLRVESSGGATEVGWDIDSANGRYYVNGTAVLGTRKTGWAASFAGSATRTTFDTTTVTTAQLAERVKALLDDLISHGVIGA